MSFHSPSVKKASSGRLKLTKTEMAPNVVTGYDDLLGDISTVIDGGRRQAVWSINASMSAVYWNIERRICGG